MCKLSYSKVTRDCMNQFVYLLVSLTRKRVTRYGLLVNVLHP